MRPAPFADLFEAIYVINLAYRADRRLEMSAELARLGLSFDDPKVTLFAAVRPEDAGEFPSVGARGCFMSHLGILHSALALGLRSILILEDDADFTADFVNLGEAGAAAVSASAWDILYLGYDVDTAPAVDPGLVRPVAPPIPVRQTHAMALRGDALSRVTAYLEQMAGRKGGDPAGGPMHVDGAYSWFRRENPDIRTAIATTPWAVQRASKTDIHDTGWKERVPFLGAARRLRNRLLRKVRT